jgi:hypothetical protein
MWSSGEPRARRRLAAALAGGVLLGTAALAGPGPLVGPAAAQSAPGVPPPQPTAPPALTAAAAVADLVVSVSVDPNRPGPTAFTVRVTSSRRPAPAPITGVRLAVSGRAVPLTAVAAGEYVGSGRLDRPGPVRAAVVVARGGARLDVPMGWSVGTAAPVDTPPAATSGTPLGGLGLLWAVLLPPLLGALVLAAQRLRRPRQHIDGPAGAGADPDGPATGDPDGSAGTDPDCPAGAGTDPDGPAGAGTDPDGPAGAGTDQAGRAVVMADPADAVLEVTS